MNWTKAHCKNDKVCKSSPSMHFAVVLCVCIGVHDTGNDFDYVYANQENALG